MHDNIEKIATQTPDLPLERQAQLRELFPEAWSEGELDFSILRQLLGDLSDESAERYRFGWSGKRESLQLLQTPSRATLRPAPDESVNFDTTQNLFIEGDNLEALKLLYKPLFNRVKMIYIDPPYNTGNDFIYPDNFADPLKNYLIQTGQKDPNGDLQTTSPDTAGRIHSRWLSMLYPRLTLARSLLRDDGVIFVSIDDNEVHHLRLLMNEVFGEENFVANVVWQHSVQPKGYLGKFSVHHNHILCYQRSESFNLEGLERTEEHNKSYSNPDDDPNGNWRSGDVRNALYRRNLIFDITTPSGKTIEPPANGWRWSKSTIENKIASGEIIFSADETRIIRKIYLANLEGRVPETMWFGKEVGTTRDAAQQLKDLFGGEAPFDTPKPTRLVKRMLEVATASKEEDIILDFFSGSGTTAQAVLELNREDGGNRRFVLVQLPEKTGNPQFPTIADIGKERIRRVIARMNEAKESQAGLAPSSNLLVLDAAIQFETQGLEDGTSPASPSSNLSLLNNGLEEGASPAPAPTSKEDLGFKVWKLGESHFRQMQRVDPKDTAAYLAQLELMNDALLPGFDPHSVLYEVALREGFGLNCSLEPVADLDGVSVWRVGDAEKGQHFFISLDDSLHLETLRPLKLAPDDLFICRGIALDDDTAANLALQCRLKMI